MEDSQVLRFKYNIVGSLSAWRDAKTAYKWVDKARSELSDVNFATCLTGAVEVLLHKHKLDSAQLIVNYKLPDDLHVSLTNLIQVHAQAISAELQQKELWNTILDLFQREKYAEAQSLYNQNQDLFLKSDYSNLYKNYLNEHRKKAKNFLSNLSNYQTKNHADINEATKTFSQLLSDAEMKVIFEHGLYSLLSLYKFEDAARMYELVQELYPSHEYQDMLRQFKQKQTTEEEQRIADKKIKGYFQEAVDFLHEGDYGKADVHAERLNPEWINKYLVKKSEVIEGEIRRLEKEVGEPLFDDEKLEVLVSTDKNILLAARAGSGKTTTIALKVHQLINHYSVKSDELLVVAFNRDAAGEFRNRINNYCGESRQVAREGNTLTFHALASRIAGTEKNLLQDSRLEPSSGTSNKYRETRDMNDFVREIYEEVEQSQRGVFSTLYYHFLRATSAAIQSAFDSSDDYYRYLRNLKHTTLAGETVKSVPEKYIGDFLFEHEIYFNGVLAEYKYEWNIKKDINYPYPYSPDFSLYCGLESELKAVVEYFGFTKKHTGYPNYFLDKEESNDYLRNAEKKRDFFKDHPIPLIEISADDTDELSLNEESGRLALEGILQDKIIAAGGEVGRRLSQREVLEKLPRAEQRRKKLIRQITSFITFARKRYEFSDKHETLTQRAEFFQSRNLLSSRTKHFLKMAIPVYEAYQNRISRGDGEYIDFDGLIALAIQQIKAGNTKFMSKGMEIDVRKLKYILIDEYQDFTDQFYQLINVCRQVNPSIRLFCVGDDWQAINGFAGSRLEYFENFENLFSPASRKYLQTNYRSDRDIVDFSNGLMTDLDSKESRAFSTQSGCVEIVPQLERIDFTSTDYEAETHPDYKFVKSAQRLIGQGNNNFFAIAKHLKTIHKILSSQNEIQNILILYRTNKFNNQVDISSIQKSITDLLPKDSKFSIKCVTAHKSKGSQEELVIVADAVNGKYPLLHPDNELLSILDYGPADVMAEERRLLYVAVTRAKHSMHIIGDTGAKQSALSEYLSRY